MPATVTVFGRTEVWAQSVAMALGRSLGCRIEVLRPGQKPDTSLRVVGEIGIEAGAERPGFIEFVRHWRLHGAFRGDAVFLGFRRQDRAARDWSMLGDRVPGTQYVRLPLPAGQLQAALQPATVPLDDQQLASVVRLYCGVEEDVRYQLHRAMNLISRIRAQTAFNVPCSARILAELADAIRVAAEGLRFLGVSDLSANGRSLADRFQKPGAVPPIGAAVEWAVLVEQTVWPTPSIAATPRRLPPPGFDSVLIVDDDWYPADALAMLTEIGYQVSVERTVEAAVNHQSYDPHAVVVCDLTLGNDPTAGERLLSEFKKTGSAALLIALSAAPLVREIVGVDGVCAGAAAKTIEGAERLHAVICEAAERRGSTS